MLQIEFAKIFKRKFNYLFGIITLLIGSFLSYRLNSISQFFEISEIETIFNVIIKIILVLVIFIMGINYIYSYREDYKTKVVTLLEVRKVKSVRDFFAVFANLVYFFLYNVVVLLGVFSVLFLKKRDILVKIVQDLLTNGHLLAYIVQLFMLLLFANLIFLLALSLFNNTNLAISLSLLYFIGSGVLVKVLSERLSETYSNLLNNSIFNVFDKAFNSLDYNVTFEINTFLPLGLNIIGLVIVIFIIKIFKKVID
ncbi:MULTISPECIES: iron ABC transporter permease [Gemella]|uniref:iron ABC transporter permease n=1 Tax=Gemella TaxID=1378 RepID=UPI000931F72F|nr:MULTISPECIES: iron ABC transporter permease [Gemella]AXI27311.1 iron ABC transporter permease [Gemella sp. ND 6198]